MYRLKIIIIVWTVKLVAKLSRLFGYQASTLPGLIGYKLDHQLLADILVGYQGQIILVSGTNGKTTTTKLIADFLISQGKSIITNDTGSNLERGILTSLILGSDWQANLKQDYLVIEIDEAELARIVITLDPDYLVLISLSRDQLDRYGEIDILAGKIGDAIRGLKSQLIINADDPLFFNLNTESDRINYGFGFPDKEIVSETYLSDMPYEQSSGERIKYHNRYLGHLGEYYTDSQRLIRPKLDYNLNNVDLDLGEFAINDRAFKTNLIGIYNYYNILASYSLINILGFDQQSYRDFLPNFQPAQGRSQKLKLEGRKLTIALAKNPVGMNQVIYYLINSGIYQKVVILVNDRVADGQDISWLYDCGFERIKPDINLYAGGVRFEDLALRLTVSGLRPSLLPTLSKQSILEGTDTDDQILLVPNYTAMQDLFGVLQ